MGAPSLAALDARLSAFEVFRQEARRIWRNADAVPLALSADLEPASSAAVAAVACREEPRSLGNHILNPQAPRTLLLSERALSYPADALRRVLIHEAVHLGIGGHRARFRAVCRAHGGSMTGSEALGSPVRLQIKVGARYRTVREYPREKIEEARLEMRAVVLRSNVRCRITY